MSSEFERLSGHVLASVQGKAREQRASDSLQRGADPGTVEVHLHQQSPGPAQVCAQPPTSRRSGNKNEKFCSETCISCANYNHNFIVKP